MNMKVQEGAEAQLQGAGGLLNLGICRIIISGIIVGEQFHIEGPAFRVARIIQDAPQRIFRIGNAALPGVDGLIEMAGKPFMGESRE